jgi:predicted nucleotidyltransferase
MNKSPQILRGEDAIAILKAKNVKGRFNLKSLSLFGSTARNEATENSDLDFVVDFEGTITFDRYMDLKICLEDLFGKKIDLALKESLKPQIRDKIVEEGIDVP